MPSPHAASPARAGAAWEEAAAPDVLRPSRRSRLLATHPWVGDAALVAAVVALGLLTGVVALATVDGTTNLGMFRPEDHVPERVVSAWLVGAVLGAALLTARRARPLLVTAVLTGLAVASLATAGVLGVLGVCLACAVHAVAATRAPRTAWATCAAVLVAVTAALWWWQDIGLAEILLWSDPIVRPDGSPPVRDLAEPPFSPGRRSASASLLLALLLLGMATGSGARARRLHAEDLAERYRAMARERDQSAALARAAERARIAREMHDVVAHSVSVMVALSDGAGAALDRAPERSREALRELSRTGREALGDMQRVLGALDPDDSGVADGDGRPAPTGTDLAAVVARFRAAGLPLTATGLDVALPADTSLRLALVRIVQEALTNVLRHAPGTAAAEVVVRRCPGTVEVEVADHGGTRPGAGGGTGRGIIGMRERAALLGGSVEAGPRPGGGWTVHVVLPWDDEGGRA